jgi:hypothetical protein
VSAVDDSFNFGKPASRYFGKHAAPRQRLDPRALSHAALAFASVVFLYLVFRLI